MDAKRLRCEILSCLVSIPKRQLRPFLNELLMESSDEAIQKLADELKLTASAPKSKWQTIIPKVLVNIFQFCSDLEILVCYERVCRSWKFASCEEGWMCWYATDVLIPKINRLPDAYLNTILYRIYQVRHIHLSGNMSLQCKSYAWLASFSVLQTLSIHDHLLRTPDFSAIAALKNTLLGLFLTVPNRGTSYPQLHCVYDMDIAISKIAQLEKLTDLQCSIFTKDASLIRLRTLGELKRLRLENASQFTGKNIGILSSSLRTLKLSGSNFNKSNIDRLTKFKELEELDLRVDNLDQNTLLQLSQIECVKKGQLQKLRVDIQVMGDDVTALLLNSFSMVKFMELSLFHCTDAYLNMITKQIPKGIHTLELQPSDVTDVALEPLKKWKKLKQIRFFGCENITDVGLMFVKHIKDIHIEACDGVTGDSFPFLRQVTTFSLKQMKNISEDDILSVVQQSPNLTKLTIIGHEWEDQNTFMTQVRSLNSKIKLEISER